MTNFILLEFNPLLPQNTMTCVTLPNVQNPVFLPLSSRTQLLFLPSQPAVVLPPSRALSSGVRDVACRQCDGNCLRSARPPAWPWDTTQVPLLHSPSWYRCPPMPGRKSQGENYEVCIYMIECCELWQRGEKKGVTEECRWGEWQNFNSSSLNYIKNFLFLFYL